MSRASTEPPETAAPPRPRDFSRHEPFLQALARRRLGRSLAEVAKAQDFVQDAFLAAYAAERRGHGPRDSGERVEAAWLRRVLATKIDESLRRGASKKHGGGVRLHPIGEGVEFPGTGTTPSRAVDRDFRVMKVKEALGRLSPRDRQVLIWMAEKQSCKGMAEQLGCSASYVSQLCKRAPERFKAAYAAVGGPTDFS